MFTLRFGSLIMSAETTVEISDWLGEQLNGLTDLEASAIFYSVPTHLAKSDWMRLRACNTKRVYKRYYILPTQVGYSIANYFFSYMGTLRAKGAPNLIEMLRVKKRRDYVVKKSFLMTKQKIIGHRHIIAVARIRSGGKGLYNFPPTAAKALYEHYCKPGARVLDFSAGFSGRLCGCMSSDNGYDYTGVDPADLAFENLNRLIAFLNVKDRARVIHKPFEDAEGDLEDESYDFAFSSPPYFNREEYGPEATQSFKRYPEPELWRDGFLAEVFRIVRRKLRPGRNMVMSIPNIEEGRKIIPLEEWAVQCGEAAGFTYEGFHKLVFRNRWQAVKGKNPRHRPLKFEKGFIFRAPAG